MIPETQALAERLARHPRWPEVSPRITPWGRFWSSPTQDGAFARMTGEVFIHADEPRLVNVSIPDLDDPATAGVLWDALRLAWCAEAPDTHDDPGPERWLVVQEYIDHVVVETWRARRYGGEPRGRYEAPSSAPPVPRPCWPCGGRNDPRPTAAQLAALDAGRQVGNEARRRAKTYRARIAEFVLCRVLAYVKDGGGVDARRALADAAAFVLAEDEKP